MTVSTLSYGTERTQALLSTGKEFFYFHHLALLMNIFFEYRSFYPLFEGQKCFLRRFFQKILPLFMVSIQERFLIKWGLQWRMYAGMVGNYIQ